MKLTKKELNLQFTEIYIEFKPKVFNYLYLKLRNIHNAEDVTTDVFIKVNRLLPTYDIKISGLSTWIGKISYSALVDFVRKNKIYRNNYMAVSDFKNIDFKNGDDKIFEFVNPEKTDIVENQELKDRLVMAFHKLKPNYRKIATLYFISDYKYKEISELLDMKLGTVKAMISRCREMLKTELNDLYSTAKKQLVT